MPCEASRRSLSLRRKIGRDKGAAARPLSQRHRREACKLYCSRCLYKPHGYPGEIGSGTRSVERMGIRLDLCRKRLRRGGETDCVGLVSAREDAPMRGDGTLDHGRRRFRGSAGLRGQQDIDGPVRKRATNFGHRLHSADGRGRSALPVRGKSYKNGIVALRHEIRR